MLTKKDLEEIATHKNKTYTNSFFSSKINVEEFYPSKYNKDILYFKTIIENEEEEFEVISKKEDFPENIESVKITLVNFHEDFFYSLIGNVTSILKKEGEVFKAFTTIKYLNAAPVLETLESNSIKKIIEKLNLRLRDSMKSGNYKHDLMEYYLDGNDLS